MIIADQSVLQLDLRLFIQLINGTVSC